MKCDSEGKFTFGAIFELLQGQVDSGGAADRGDVKRVELTRRRRGEAQLLGHLLCRLHGFFLYVCQGEPEPHFDLFSLLNWGYANIGYIQFKSTYV